MNRTSLAMNAAIRQAAGRAVRIDVDAEPGRSGQDKLADSGSTEPSRAAVRTPVGNAGAGLTRIPRPRVGSVPEQMNKILRATAKGWNVYDL